MAKKKKAYQKFGEERSERRSAIYYVTKGIVASDSPPFIALGEGERKAAYNTRFESGGTARRPFGSDLLKIEPVSDHRFADESYTPWTSQLAVTRSRLIGQINGYALMRAGAEAVESQIHREIRSIWASIDSPDHHLQYVRSRLAEALS